MFIVPHAGALTSVNLTRERQDGFSLAGMDFTPDAIGALVVATCFAAGLNLYATVLTLGVLARLHWVALPSGLDVLGSWTIIIIAAVMFTAEFFADKIPGFDLLWNAAHTFIRVPAAALLAYRASEHLSPDMQLAATTAGAMIAMATHSSKTALRAAVTASPEPFTNIALSTSEDAGAIGLSWVATHHPFAAAGVAAGVLLLALLCVTWLVRRLRRVMTSFSWRRSLGLDGLVNREHQAGPVTLQRPGN